MDFNPSEMIGLIESGGGALMGGVKSISSFKLKKIFLNGYVKNDQLYKQMFIWR